MDRALQQATSSNKLKLIKAECLAFLGRYEEAQNIANDILHIDSLNVDALYVRGMCLYYQDFIEKSYSHLQQVLKLAPDYSKALELYRRVKLLITKKDEGNEAFKNGHLQEAYELYSCALEIDPSNVYTNAKLYFNRATVCSKISKLNQAIEDCTQAIKLDENYIKAYLRRAKW
ncbi:dnaJ homolog subfamily C member 7-like [Limulus polyphemus]|uniref:DnaJ homolog subfamily C member 7-like n=1 Tax=Limulus polyphemus TaxID=6850 RepID=A0ABM1BAT0_LIMPO|nr:dnaJ homolog subfamily C member 7-like [Limulus polyphemus]